MAPKPFLTSSLGKHIWVISSITFTILRLPFWLTYYIVPSNRPSPKWTYSQALRIRLLKVFVATISRTQSAPKLTLHPGKEGARFTTINPAPPSHYQGITKSNPNITPQPIGGTWYPAAPTDTQKIHNIILHFHGGAYVIGDGRSKDAGFAAATLLANSRASHIFCPQYRLSAPSDPAAKFPAALQDAITSLHHLTHTLHLKAENIVVSGDSAGGNLVLALLRYLHDHPDAGLPNPACAWLWSPWVDPGSALLADGFAGSARAATDFLDAEFGAWGARAFQPADGTGVGWQHPSISFVGNTAFASATPMFFSVGECEILFEDGVRAYEGFAAVGGNRVELWVEEGAVHDIILLGAMLGFAGEAALAVRRAADFWARGG
ncbi:hypothetical protein DSL72_009165 [Monilinia vaccinii-corymbosi]|uniref:Alpha/beta hydrolase fold-3 domain-containing protein n=1 Tax=Monilinia vaccinii-corymbosi TaxID=61207 RepID=A0A8A3PPY5_9HELO|nr:hypothetical protein DSL72_009165 [Monilinia vaccinii-corymbosi]